MHSEVPFAAWGRDIFCQEASPGRLGFILLALYIFNLFAICVLGCALFVVRSWNNHHLLTVPFSSCSTWHIDGSLERYSVFSLVVLAFLCAILECVLHLQNVKTILERKTFACCPPKCSLSIIFQNLNSHIAVHCLYSLSLKKWTFTVTLPVRNSECKFPKLHLSYCLKTCIVALYLANKCYRMYHKPIYSVKIMAGKK